MKRILAAIMCAAFLAVPVYAGGGKACGDKTAKSCCAQKQVAKKGSCDQSAKAECSKTAKAECNKSAQKESSSCCAGSSASAQECTTCPSGWFMGRNKAECGKCQTASL